jgi:hypothetical protein
MLRPGLETVTLNRDLNFKLKPVISEETVTLESLCWLFIFKVTEPSSIPYRTHPACAKRAAYPDPPPVIPLPESRVAGVTSLPSPRSLSHISEVDQDRTD